MIRCLLWELCENPVTKHVTHKCTEDESLTSWTLLLATRWEGRRQKMNEQL